jgi:hypothetical protein
MIPKQHQQGENGGEPRYQSGIPKTPIVDRRHLRIEPRSYEQLRREKQTAASDFAPKGISTPERAKSIQKSLINVSPVATKYPGSYRNTEASMVANVEEAERNDHVVPLNETGDRGPEHSTDESDDDSDKDSETERKVDQIAQDMEKTLTIQRGHDQVGRETRHKGNRPLPKRPESIYQSAPDNEPLYQNTRIKEQQKIDRKLKNRPESIHHIETDPSPDYQNCKKSGKASSNQSGSGEHIYEEIQKPQGAIPKKNPQSRAIGNPITEESGFYGFKDPKENEPRIREKEQNNSTVENPWNPEWGEMEPRTILENLQETATKGKKRVKFPTKPDKITERLKTEDYDWVDAVNMEDPSLRRGASKEELRMLGYNFLRDKVGTVTLKMALKAAQKQRRISPRFKNPPLEEARRGTRVRKKNKFLIQEV